MSHSHNKNSSQINLDTHSNFNLYENNISKILKYSKYKKTFIFFLMYMFAVNILLLLFPFYFFSYPILFRKNIVNLVYHSICIFIELIIIIIFLKFKTNRKFSNLRKILKNKICYFECFFIIKICTDQIFPYYLIINSNYFLIELKIILFFFLYLNISIFNYFKTILNILSTRSSTYFFTIIILVIESILISFLFQDETENIQKTEFINSFDLNNFTNSLSMNGNFTVQIMNSESVSNNYTTINKIFFELGKLLFYLFLFIENKKNLEIFNSKKNKKFKIKTLESIILFLKNNFEDPKDNGLILIKKNSFGEEFKKIYETENFFDNLNEYLLTKGGLVGNFKFLPFNSQNNNISNIILQKNIISEEKNGFFSTSSSLNNFLLNDKRFINNFYNEKNSNNLLSRRRGSLNNESTTYFFRRIPNSTTNLNKYRERLKIPVPKRVSSNPMINLNLINPLDLIEEISEGEYSQIINKHKISIRKSSKLKLGSMNRLDKKFTPRNSVYLNPMKNSTTFKLGSSDKVVKKSLSNNKQNIENKISKKKGILDSISSSESSGEKRKKLIVFSIIKEEKNEDVRRNSYLNVDGIVENQNDHMTNSEILSKEIFENKDSSSRSDSNSPKSRISRKTQRTFNNETYLQKKEVEKIIFENKILNIKYKKLSEQNVNLKSLSNNHLNLNMKKISNNDIKINIFSDKNLEVVNDKYNILLNNNEEDENLNTVRKSTNLKYLNSQPEELGICRDYSEKNEHSDIRLKDKISKDNLNKNYLSSNTCRFNNVPINNEFITIQGNDLEKSKLNSSILVQSTQNLLLNEKMDFLNKINNKIDTTKRHNSDKHFRNFNFNFNKNDFIEKENKDKEQTLNYVKTDNNLDIFSKKLTVVNNFNKNNNSFEKNSIKILIKEKSKNNLVTNNNKKNKLEFFKNNIYISIFVYNYNNNININLSSARLVSNESINSEIVELFTNTSENGCINFNYFFNSLIKIIDNCKDFDFSNDIGPFLIKSEENDLSKRNLGEINNFPNLNSENYFYKRKCILISIKRYKKDLSFNLSENNYMIFLKDYKNKIKSSGNFNNKIPYYSNLYSNSNSAVNVVKDKNLGSNEFNNFYRGNNLYNPSTINFNINQNISINNNLNKNPKDENYFNPSNYENINPTFNNICNINTNNVLSNKNSVNGNNQTIIINNNNNNITNQNSYRNNKILKSTLSSKNLSYQIPEYNQIFNSPSRSTNNKKGISNSIINNSNHNLNNLNIITDKLSAILHDFKHVIYDNLIFFEFLVNKYILKLPMYENDSTKNVIASNYDFAIIKDELNYFSVMKEYTLSLIVNITNFMSNNEFLVGEFTNNIDFIKIINIMIKIFNRRLEYENSINKNENDHEINTEDPSVIKKCSYKNKNIKIKCIIIDPENPLYTKIYSNQNLLISLFYNIMSNSYKYTDNGEIVVELSIMKINNKHNILVKISDTGKGIPQEILDNWGKPFNLFDKSQGTGLGQFIISTLEKNLGLLIPKPERNSKFSNGTVFNVYIPVNSEFNDKGSNVGMTIIGNSAFNPFQVQQSSFHLKSTRIHNETLKIEENFKNFIDYDDNALAKKFFIRTIYILCLDDEHIFLNALNKKLKSFTNELENYKFEVIFTSTFQDFLNEFVNFINKNIVVDFFIFDQNISENIKGLDCARIVNNFYKIYFKDKFSVLDFYFFFITEDLEIMKLIAKDKKLKKFLNKDQIFGKFQFDDMFIKIKNIIQYKDREMFKTSRKNFI